MQEQKSLIPKRKSNKVGMVNTCKISVWAERNRERIANMTCREAAAIVQKELAIDVPLTGSTMRTIFRSQTIPFREKRHLNGNGKSSGLDRLAELEKQVADLTARVRNLEISLGGVRN